jgi:hypothetical protein
VQKPLGLVVMVALGVKTAVIKAFQPIQLFDVVDLAACMVAAEQQVFQTLPAT